MVLNRDQQAVVELRQGGRLLIEMHDVGQTVGVVVAEVGDDLRIVLDISAEE